MEKTGAKVRTVISKAWEVRKLANEIMFYGGMIAAILFGVGAIILFFVFRIYAVIGELTGITAKRSIRKIQKEGYEGKSKMRAIRENTDEIVTKRGRTTRRLQPKEQVALDNQNVKDETVVLNQNSEDETTVLHQNVNNETVVVNQNSGDETTVLHQNVEEGTTVLQQPQIRFEVVEDVVVTHSDVSVGGEREE